MSNPRTVLSACVRYQSCGYGPSFSTIPSRAGQKQVAVIPHSPSPAPAASMPSSETGRSCHAQRRPLPVGTVRGAVTHRCRQRAAEHAARRAREPVGFLDRCHRRGDGLLLPRLHARLLDHAAADRPGRAHPRVRGAGLAVLLRPAGARVVRGSGGVGRRAPAERCLHGRHLYHCRELAERRGHQREPRPAAFAVPDRQPGLDGGGAVPVAGGGSARLRALRADLGAGLAGGGAAHAHALPGAAPRAARLDQPRGARAPRAAHGRRHSAVAR